MAVALTFVAVVVFVARGNGGSKPIDVAGRVVREDARTHRLFAVPGARVWINLDGSTTTTDADGRFSVQSRRRIGEGAEFYVLHAAKDGQTIGRQLLPANIDGIELVLPPLEARR